MNYMPSNARFRSRPLAELVTFLDHMRRPIREEDRKPGIYPYLGANGPQGTIDGYLFDEPLVLLAEDGGHFDEPERGIAYRVSGKVWVNNHAHILRPGPEVDWAYLCRALEHRDIRPYISGTTRAKLTKGQAERIEIPVPPLGEQRRIAAILDEADALRAKRRAALAQLDDMAQAIFVEMFGSKGNEAPGTVMATLADVVRTGTIITYGIVQAGDEFPGGVPYIRTGDIVNDEIRLDSLRHTDPLLAAKFKRSRVEVGEIVMSIRATVGTAAMVPQALDGANLTQGTARIAPGSRADGHFLLNYIRSSETQTWLEKQVKGATFREITLARLREMPVAVPPLPMQTTFASRIKMLERLQAKSKIAREATDTLFASLQHRAFRGEL